MHTPASHQISRQLRRSTALSTLLCSLALLTASNAAWGAGQVDTPDLSAQNLDRLHAPILPPQAAVCRPVIMEGVARSRGFSGKVLLAADPQARVVTLQVTDAGPANFALGVAGAQAWVKDFGGVVSRADFDAYRAGLISDAYWASGGLMNTCWPAQMHFLRSDKINGVRADVFEVLPEGGNTTQVWISGKTQLPLRWTRRDEPGVATVSYAAYGKGRYLGIPFKQSWINRDGNRWDLTFNKVQTGADPLLVAAKAQAAGPGAADYSIEGGDSTTVPMRLTEQPHVDVFINGKGPFNFLLDTGGALLLSKTTAKTLGLKLVGAGSETGMAGLVTPEKFMRIEDLQIGEAHVRNQYSAVMEARSAGFDAQTAGVIGYEILARFTTRFDFPKQTLTLSLAPDSSLDDHDALPFALDHTIPAVKATLNGVPTYVWLDTGYNGTLLVNRPFTQTHAEAMPARLYDTGASLSGTGGSGSIKLGRMAHMTLGSLSLDDVAAYFSNFSNGLNTDAEFAADAGDALLTSSVLTFDYRSRRAWLTTSAAAAPPSLAHYNKTGFNLQYKAGKGATVSYVREGSPAAELGLKQDDQIVSIDQQGVSADTVAALKHSIETESLEPIRLSVLRDGKVSDMELQPRAYIQ
jgi:hypothetical protein